MPQGGGGAPDLELLCGVTREEVGDAAKPDRLREEEERAGICAAGPGRR